MKNLATERRLMGLTQEQMAEHVGCATSTYNLYEKGNRSIPLHAAETIVRVLGGSVRDYFLPKWFALRECNAAPDKETA